MSAIQIVERLPEPHMLNQAVQVFYTAFERKVNHLELFPRNKEHALHLLARFLRQESGFYALSEGRVTGVVGLEQEGIPHFIETPHAAFVEEFGWWGGTWRYLWRRFIHMEEKRRPDEIRIAGIAVDESMRGKGVGTLLLDAVFAYARQKGYRAVVLEVVNTNPAAQKLYERLGFEVVKQERYGFVTQKAGFTGATFMRKTL